MDGIMLRVVIVRTEVAVEAFLSVLFWVLPVQLFSFWEIESLVKRGKVVEVVVSYATSPW